MEHIRQDMGKVARLALPSIIENIMLTMVNIVDTAMVGSLGKEATSATAVNSSPLWLINSTSMAISVGATVMVARCWGAGDFEAGGRFARQAFVLSFALGFLISVTAFFLAPFIPVWMGADAAVHADASAYMRILSLSFVPHFMGLILSGCMRGTGDTKTPMIVSLIINGISVIGNFLLIFPTRTIRFFGEFTMWGAGLGVRGAAISSAISFATSGILLLIVMLRRRDVLRLTTKVSYRLNLADIRDMLRIGLPAAAERMATSLGNIFYTSIVASLGTASLAAHHLAITAEGICYNPVFGFSVAATTLVGQASGAGDAKAATRYGRINIALGALTMTAVGTLMYLFAPWLIRIFTPDTEVVALGSMALRIIAFAEPFFGIFIVSSGALRGAGDTVVPLLIGIIGVWCVRIVLAHILVNVVGMGLAGAWIAMLIDLIIRGILTYARFHSGGWRRRAMLA